MKAEFDGYARDYERLLKDPIRERFASSSEFFSAVESSASLDAAARARSSFSCVVARVMEETLIFWKLFVSSAQESTSQFFVPCPTQ